MNVKKIMLYIVMAVCLLCGCNNNHNTNIDAGMQALKELDYTRAMECFQLAEEENENARMIARGRGIACIGMMDYESGTKYLEDALKQSNGRIQEFDYDVNYYLAVAYAKSNQLKKAEGVYSSILALRQDPECYYLRGAVRLELNQIKDAQEDFSKAISLEPTNYDRMIRIYETLAQKGYAEEGKKYLTQAINKSEKISNYDAGRLSYYLGDYEKAYLLLEEAKETGKAEAYLYLGKAYEATGDYNYASSVYNRYIEMDQTHPEIYNQLGLCEMSRGDYQAALTAFQAGMKIENNELLQTLQFNEIIVYEYLQEFQKAEVLMDHYLKTYPDDSEAQREYEFLLTR